MSPILDRLRFFRRRGTPFSEGHGVVTREDRSWEAGYRGRWRHDKVVRSTHGVNCTGGCSWNVYVKDGLVTWETQATDYPRSRPDLPDFEPRGCPRGASYSWHLYSGSRLKRPLARSRLVWLWREARRTMNPVEAWASIALDPEKVHAYRSVRGLGGFVRLGWDEALEMIAASTIHTIETHGPDRVVGFSPIPAMSMISYAAGTRFLSLIGGGVLSFYDWYCDLPPSSPQSFGEQTDVPVSADWYESTFLLVWGSNVPQTRTPDAHFLVEARYRGTKTVVISPDFSEASKFADLWLAPRPGTDAALALAMGRVVFRERHVEGREPWFEDYARRFTDMPLLVRLDPREGGFAPGRLLRASDFEGALGQSEHAEWKPVGIDELTDEIVAPQGSAGFRWEEGGGRWNLEPRDAATGREIRLRLSLIDHRDDLATLLLPDFETGALRRMVAPVKRLRLAEGEVLVASVFDLMAANYAIDRGIGGEVAPDDDAERAPTPAWAARRTGLDVRHIVATARNFADNAAKTRGRSMVIIGNGLNQWYHGDMAYRAVIALLAMCGCIGRTGGGFAHYVGQEKVRPLAGWSTLAFALDWTRPPRHMNGTSFFYLHSDQWRYERLSVEGLLAPGEPRAGWDATFADLNLRAQRMGWLPSLPHLQRNPINIAREAEAAGVETPDFVAEGLKSGALRFAAEDPDRPQNFPRVMFVWRSNLLGASGRGAEYFLRHLVGAVHGVQTLEPMDEAAEPREVARPEPPPEGKLDLLVAIDFRMSTTGLHADIVLPTASWYEKDDLNTTDLHPFIHPLSKAVEPVWESRTDWRIFRDLARVFSRLCEGRLGRERDVVLSPLQHDTPSELGQALDVKDWGRGECEPIPGRTMPQVEVVERDYPATYDRFVSLGPLVETRGVSAKGVSWRAEGEVEELAMRFGRAPNGRPRMETERQAAETLLALAPETNGRVAERAWDALSKKTGRDHGHIAAPQRESRIRFDDILAQPRRTLNSPIWSGVESETTTYTGFYNNVEELIPWRTLSGRQQLYQDHAWFRAFGEALPVYKAAVDTRTITPSLRPLIERTGPPGIVLNFLTPHQKWGIHSTFTENVVMLTLSRGGPTIWISETDAARAGIEDNDWIEALNLNGALVARAIVSQRMPAGACMMYHAQEKLVNTPGSPFMRRRGIHNSVTRILMKPTHMVGGYAHLSYFINYYGTVGANRDEHVVIRRLDRVGWMERPLHPIGAEARS